MLTRRDAIRLLGAFGLLALFGPSGCALRAGRRRAAPAPAAPEALRAVPHEALPDGAVVMRANLPRPGPEVAVLVEAGTPAGGLEPVLLVAGRDGALGAYSRLDAASGAELLPVRSGGRLFWECPRWGSRYDWELSRVLRGPSDRLPRRYGLSEGPESLQVVGRSGDAPVESSP
ncbi:MAG: hypothetical protein SF028_03170 [Candidatus Sumerlaeia bacterium]|nr:hypothetical protein [Candidatus Sumerlaeia bacterium]